MVAFVPNPTIFILLFHWLLNLFHFFAFNFVFCLQQLYVLKYVSLANCNSVSLKLKHPNANKTENVTNNKIGENTNKSLKVERSLATHVYPLFVLDVMPYCTVSMKKTIFCDYHRVHRMHTLHTAHIIIIDLLKIVIFCA